LCRETTGRIKKTDAWLWTRVEVVRIESEANQNQEGAQNVVEELLASFGLLMHSPLGKGEKMKSRGF
jgi:hypothetical protein